MSRPWSAMGAPAPRKTAGIAGAPQLVIPQMFDQHYWAERVGHLGIGRAHAAGAPTAESLTGVS